MKKFIIAILAVSCLFCFAGCSSNDNGNLPFETSDVESIDIFHYVVPTDAEKKVVTEQADIETLYKAFDEIKLSTKDAETLTGGDTFGFRFCLSDGVTYEIICSECDGEQYKLLFLTDGTGYSTKNDIGQYYSTLAENYDTVSVEENELPK